METVKYRNIISQILDGLVDEYRRNHLKNKREELNRFRSMTSLEEVFENIFLDEQNRQYNHQRQGEITRETTIKTLLSISEDIQRCQNFDELFNLLRTQVQRRVENIGIMFIYDASLRIGAFLRFLPQKVYLIKGAAEGAKALGLIKSSRVLEILPVEDFPPELQNLEPYEIHHFLCVYGAVILLRSWREEDEVEQRETWEYLKQSLEEDRFAT